MDALSVEQAADYLECAASRIYRLIHSQQLAATKVNRYWYVCRQSLRQFFWQEMLEKGQSLLSTHEYAAARKIFEVLIQHFPDQVEGYFFSARAAELDQDLRSALRYYRQAVKDFADDASHRALARLYFSQNKFSKALLHYQLLLERFPGDRKLHYNLGLTYKALQRPEDARRCLLQAIEIDPAYARAYHALAYLLYQHADYEEALNRYHEALALDAGEIDYCSGIAHCYQALGQLEQAAIWYEKSLELEKASPRLHYSLALVYEDLKWYDKAYTAYQAYLRYYPYCIDALNNQALILLHLERNQEAHKLLKRSIELEPDNWVSHYHLALVNLRLEHKQEAASIYERTLTLAPAQEHGELYAGLAYTYYLLADYVRAESMCSQALSQHPEMNDPRLIQAGVAYNQESYDQAIAIYKQLLPGAEDPFVICYNLGLCYHRQGDYQQAISVYQQALEHKNEVPQVYHALGYAYQASREYLKAIRYYYHALALDPDYEASLYNLAQIFMEQQDFKQALKWLKKLLVVRPDLMEAWIQAGFAYDNLNQLSDAIECYHEALQREPENMSLYMILGLASSRDNQLDRALKIYQQALARLPDEAGEIYYLMGLAFLNADRKSKAISAFERSLKYASNNLAEAATHLGHLYLQQAKPVKAIRCFRLVIADDLQNAQAYLNLAQAYALKKDVPRFKKYSQRALRLRPNDPENLFQVALLYYRNDQWREAISHFQQVVQLDPKHVSAHNYLGSIYRSMGCNLEAIRSFRWALNVDPDYCVVYLNLSYTYFDMHDSAKAIHYCKEAIRCEPDCEEPQYWLGHLYASEGKWPAALNAFEQVLSLNPEHAKALHWLPIARKQWIRQRNGTQPLEFPVS